MKRWGRFVSLLLLVAGLVTSGASCTGGTTTGGTAPTYKKTTVTMWIVNDDTEMYRDVVAAYRETHSNVSITLKKLTYAEYEQALLGAFAVDEGPDIFMFHNTWTKKYQDLLSPMPATVLIPVKETTGGVKPKEVISVKTVKMPTLADIKSQFVDVVALDAAVTTQGKTSVYGLPMSVDSLALFYNKDILNNASIPVPAQYWTDLVPQVAKLRKLDGEGNLIVSAIPLGTSTNVPRSFDVLSLLMMQLKAEMIDEAGDVAINRTPRALQNEPGITEPPGMNALTFYTQFANPTLSGYTWNEEMPNGLDAFINGQSAYYLGYSYNRPVIDARAPKMNYAVAPMLQVQGYTAVNYANYWMYGVANKSKNKDYAWDIIRFMTTAEQAPKYLTAAKHPAALRSLYNSQVDDEYLSAFVKQTLTAKSWYRGYDSAAAEDIFKKMIDSVNNQGVEVKDAVNLAADQLQQTLRKK